MAEDNMVNQEVALTVISKLGYHADAVTNGKEAICALGSTEYALVLMDIQMPEMDGLAATRAIRSGATAVINPAIPVIAMTANAMQSDREQCQAAGMNDYISKPFTKEALAQILSLWLTAPPVQPPSHPEAAPLATQNDDQPPQPIFDCQEFKHRLDLDDQSAHRFLTMFLNTMPPSLLELKTLIDRHNLNAAWSVAHRIKGSAAMISCGEISAAAQAIELAGKAGNQAAAEELLLQLEGAYHKLCAFLDQQEPQANKQTLVLAASHQSSGLTPLIT